jgi:serine/threonine-protein kinase
VSLSHPSLLTQQTYRPGDEIVGKYRLDTLLGEGGMGSVWAATNLLLDAPVAIKLIRGDLNRDAFAARLHQEARAAAKLGHPAIVRVFDVGETVLGDPFIVMELLQGRSLSSVLMEEGRLPAARAIQLLLPIAEALSLAHAKGIVHRDLKPDNVFLVEDGGQVQPKLVDFGIAKLEPRLGASHLTHGGVVLGSPEYMSPEQARGDADVDHRSDIWSFCVMLFEAMTGVLPFTGTNYNAQLRSILEEVPKSIREFVTGDDELALIVNIGLEKDRERRFRSMDDLGSALARWLLNYGIQEDVCGVSLITKWVERNSDVGALGRASRVSLAEIAAPYSGVRPTEPRSMPAATPEPAGPAGLVDRAKRLLAERPELRIVVPATLAVLVALVLLFTRGGDPEERADAVEPPRAPPTAAPPKVVVAQPEPARQPPRPAAIEPPKVEPTHVTASVPASPPKAARRPAADAPQPKGEPPVPSVTAPPAPTDKPPLDLIAPY